MRMDVEIFLLPPVRTRLDMLERDISDCLERIQDAIVAGRVDLVRHFERRLFLTDYMLRKTAA